MGGAICVGQYDQQVALVVLLPVAQHLVGRGGELLVAVGKRRIDHRQLVRVGTDGLNLAPHGDEAVGRAGEGVTQPLHHRLHAPVLPQEAMAAARAEIGNLQAGQGLEALHLLPHPRHGTGIEHLQLELAHGGEHSARAQLVQDGERRNFPEGRLQPRPVELKLVLAVADPEVIGWQLEALEPFDELRREHLPLAVEHVAAQPGRFAPSQPQASGVVELLAQGALLDEVREADILRAVEDREGDARVAMAPEDRLRHQQLVEIRVEQGADDRIDLPLVIVDTCGDVRHAPAPWALSAFSRAETRRWPASEARTASACRRRITPGPTRRRGAPAPRRRWRVRT